jgi:hypothetical protein
MPKKLASGVLASSLAAALPDGLSEHPARCIGNVSNLDTCGGIGVKMSCSTTC